MTEQKLKKLILYQRWPGRKLGRFEISEEGLPTIAINTLPLSTAGISQAIELADRKDAKLVIIDKTYTSGTKLNRAIEKKVAKGKFKLLFQPVKASEVIDA
jgi:hypothetical protein